MSLAVSEKLSERGMLQGYQKSLVEIDTKIQCLRVAEDTLSESELDVELLSCQEYLDKI